MFAFWTLDFSVSLLPSISSLFVYMCVYTNLNEWMYYFVIWMQNVDTNWKCRFNMDDICLSQSRHDFLFLVVSLYSLISTPPPPLCFIHFTLASSSHTHTFTLRHVKWYLFNLVNVSMSKWSFFVRQLLLVFSYKWKRSALINLLIYSAYWSGGECERAEMVKKNCNRLKTSRQLNVAKMKLKLWDELFLNSKEMEKKDMERAFNGTISHYKSLFIFIQSLSNFAFIRRVCMYAFGSHSKNLLLKL